jgi:UTP--glucose-1-phosphate uridylyltransferase
VNIRKAIITAAGRTQNTIPLQVLVDCDGRQKSALRIILEEAFSTGVDEVAVVICPGDEPAYRAAAGRLPGKLHFVEQPEPLGYAHALLCAREFVGRDPFLHFVSDHLYLSRNTKRCAELLVEIASAHDCSVSAVQATRENMLPYYGVIGGKGVAHKQHLYQVETVLEKPTPTEAEQSLIVPGLRVGHYLCFFGMHVFTATFLDILAELRKSDKNRTPYLADGLVELIRREKYLAFEIPGRRYNLGVKFGTLTAQLALGLAGQDREEVLAQLLEVVAARAGDAEKCQAN